MSFLSLLSHFLPICRPKKLVKIFIAEAVVVTVEVLVLGGLDAVVQVTAKKVLKK